MPSILPEDPFVEIVEGRISVDFVRKNPGPVIAAVFAGGPLRKLFEGASGVSALTNTCQTYRSTVVWKIFGEMLFTTIEPAQSRERIELGGVSSIQETTEAIISLFNALYIGTRFL